MNFKNSTSAALILLLIGGSQWLSAQKIIEPVEIQLAHPEIINFQDLSDMELIHPTAKHRFVEQGEDREKNFKYVPQGVPFDAVQNILPEVLSHKALINSPVPTVSFNGVMDNGTLIPPDIRGAAGPTYIMETTNQEFKIYSKTGTLKSTLSITTFFSATGGSGYFDPHVMYDPVNGRFVACIDGNVSNGHGGLFIAVSQTSDPTGSWYVYSFDAAGNTTDFIDYPMLGYNTNWIVLTANDFLSNNSVVSKVFVLNRALLYSGTASAVSTFTDNTAFTIAPAQTYDMSQTTEYLVTDWNGNTGGSGYVRLSTITGTASAPVYTVSSTVGINQPWSETSVAAKQSGSTRTLESGDTRIGNALYLNGSLWFCHTVFLPTTSPKRSAVDWWQMNPATNAVQQFGRIDNATGPVYYFYPSINVNANGDALLGYCQSSSTTFASAAYSLHGGGDAAGTMRTSNIYKSGVAAYYKTYGGGRNRWGDYSGTAVDPVDNSFWNFSEWANTANNWGTVIANVPASSTAPACGLAAGTSTTSIANTTATFNWGAVTGATSYNIQYRTIGATSWNSVSAGLNTSYSATGLTAGTNYEWQVQTVCSSGSSAFTASTNFTTTGTVCGVPTSLSAGSLNNTGATLSWSSVAGADSFILQWKVSAAATWNSITGIITNSYVLSGLTACTAYQYQVQTICPANASAFSTAGSFTTTGCAITYCASKGTSTTYEYIKTIAIGTINNTSGNNAGYGNYTALNTNLAGGANTTITLTPGYASTAYREYWTVYIDYNHNGLFTDAGETVTTGNATAALAKTFTVPTTALNGATRMRIQMQYNAQQTNPCATYTYGEVEDYTVNITGNAAAPVLAGPISASESESVLSLYPNPTHDNLTIEFNSGNDGTGSINVYNLQGQKVVHKPIASTSGPNKENVSTIELSNGIYILELINNGSATRKRFEVSK